MIVECINDNWFNISGTKSSGPVKGELYEVIGEDFVEEYEGRPVYKLFYLLREFKANDYWASHHFKQVDIDISEIEQVEELLNV